MEIISQFASATVKFRSDFYFLSFSLHFFLYKEPLWLIHEAQTHFSSLFSPFPYLVPFLKGLSNFKHKSNTPLYSRKSRNRLHSAKSKKSLSPRSPRKEESQLQTQRSLHHRSSQGNINPSVNKSTRRLSISKQHTSIPSPSSPLQLFGSTPSLPKKSLSLSILPPEIYTPRTKAGVRDTKSAYSAVYETMVEASRKTHNIDDENRPITATALWTLSRTMQSVASETQPKIGRRGSVSRNMKMTNSTSHPVLPSSLPSKE